MRDSPYCDAKALVRRSSLTILWEFLCLLTAPVKISEIQTLKSEFAHPIK